MGGGSYSSSGFEGGNELRYWDRERAWRGRRSPVMYSVELGGPAEGSVEGREVEEVGARAEGSTSIELEGRERAETGTEVLASLVLRGAGSSSTSIPTDAGLGGAGSAFAGSSIFAGSGTAVGSAVGAERGCSAGFSSASGGEDGASASAGAASAAGADSSTAGSGAGAVSVTTGAGSDVGAGSGADSAAGACPPASEAIAASSLSTS